MDVEEAAHAMACTMKVVQSRIPQCSTRKRIQKVAWGGHRGLELQITLCIGLSVDPVLSRMWQEVTMKA